MILEQIGWTPALAFYFSEFCDSSWVAGRISRVDRGRVIIRTEAGESPGRWNAPISVVDSRPVEMPAVGDWCAVSQRGELLFIEALLPRSTCVSRSVEDGHRSTQVVAANIDVAFLVTGLDKDFNVRRIERYLALARSGGVRPVIILNKADLCADAEDRREQVAAVAQGTPLLLLSALDGAATAAIREHLGGGQTAVFLGSSGAGKSTLINGLLGERRQETAPVRADDHRGRHTTTRREMLLLPDGGAVIDTPGLRAVGIPADEANLERAFADILEHAHGCRFGDCRHETEPECTVLAAVEQGIIERRHYENFIKLRREAENATLRQDAYAKRTEERRTIGKYRKQLRDVYRFKGRS